VLQIADLSREQKLNLLNNQLVIMNFRLKLKKRESPDKRRKFDVGRLKDPETAAAYNRSTVCSL